MVRNRLIYSCLLLAFLPSCKRELTQRPNVNGTRYNGTILFEMCGNIAVRFTDGTAMGQMNWRRDGDSTVYNNVFRVANPCTWGWDGKTNDVTFVMTTAKPQQCVQCMAWTATPDTAYHILILN
jgi:hypothetical protein